MAGWRRSRAFREHAIPAQRTLARVRDAIGDEQTDMLLDRGAAMTYDEVIGYALEELG